MLLRYGLCLQIFLSGFMAMLPDRVYGVGDEYLSPVAILADPQGSCLYLAEHTAARIAVYDLGRKQVVQTLPLSARPNGLALSRNGQTLYVTAHSNDGNGRLLAFSLPTGELVSELLAGHSPCSPVLNSDGKTIYVCSQFEHAVLVIDLESGTVVRKIAVSREPISARLSLDGKYLFVAGKLHDGSALQDRVAARISVVDTEKQELVKQISLPDGSSDLQQTCLSPDGRYLYVTHILARYPLPTTQVDRGWMNTNAVSIIDCINQTYLNTFLLDDMDRGAANPWGIACTDDGRSLIVSHAGTHEISVIDRVALHAKLPSADAEVRGATSTPSAVPVKDDFSFLADIRTRIPLAGKGPRGLAVNGSVVYVAEYFSDSLGIVPLPPEPEPQAFSVPLGTPVPLSPVRLGEQLFHDATIGFQQWQSCVSCHPGDARMDGLNWDLLNDGVGNPKNAKSLLYSHQTPPAMISGIRDRAETAVRSGIKYILFAERPAAEADAIDAYLQSLRPVASPYLRNGELSPAARNGQRIFEKAGCSDCHSGPYYTNLQSYRVGTGNGSALNPQLDTPTLIEVWRTAPYLYDGRAATMQEVFTTCNPEDKHGVTSHLSEQEIQDLVEFVLSL